MKATGQVWKLPYGIYYLSCNLDHALYGKLNSSDEEKEEDAYQFAKQYRNDILGFLKYIRESELAVGPDYKESWEYISEGRYTNAGICFNTKENE